MNQPIKRRVLPLVLSFCMFLTCACGKGEPKQQTTPDASFGEYVTELYNNEVVADTLTLHYSLAHPENYGITMGEVTYGNYSQKEVTDSMPEIEASREKLLTFDYDTLCEEDQVLYDCLQSMPILHWVNMSIIPNP